jgi:hypothetical protein
MTATTSETSKTFSASVAHRYWHPGWPETENRETFGADAYPEGLGANLDVVVTAKNISSESELEPALIQLKSAIDHQCLFEGEHSLSRGPSSLERITEFLVENLKTLSLSHGEWAALEVKESSRLSCYWRAPSEFSLRVRCFNLILTLTGPVDSDSGLILPHGAADQAVRRVFFATGNKVEHDLNKWGSGLFTALASELPLLTKLRIDLPRQEYLIFNNNV